jgi:chromosome segregation ATPase
LFICLSPLFNTSSSPVETDRATAGATSLSDPRRPTVSSTPTITGATEPASALERSRARSSEARSSLEAAHLRLSHLDAELGRNAARSSSDETALRSAMDEVKRLKKALKDGEKQRRKLLTERKRAADATAKAEDRARKAEAKYDRAVLADMIQRTKEQDRRTASEKAPENGSAATPAVPATAVDGTEPEDLGTATARETAARTTAQLASSTAAGSTPQPRAADTTSAES